MDRRSIFKSFLPVLVVPLLAKAEPEPDFGIPGGKITVVNKDKAEFTHRGWLARWTGWKSSQATVDLAAQWYARKNGWPFGLYVSNPGTWGTFFKGATLDISWRLGKVLVTEKSHKAELNAVQEEMRTSIVRLIDKAEDDEWKSRFEGNIIFGLELDDLPVTNPELRHPADRHNWKRYSPELIAAIREEEAKEEAKEPSCKFGFTGFKEYDMLDAPNAFEPGHFLKQS